MKIKLISLIALLVTLSACANIATNNSESLRLMNGSNLIIKNNKVLKITDSTGTAVEIQKGKMEELANGKFIYVRQDGSVNRMGGNESANGHGSKNSSSGHSH